MSRLSWCDAVTVFIVFAFACFISTLIRAIQGDNRHFAPHPDVGI